MKYKQGKYRHNHVITYTCCPWSHGLWSKKLSVHVVVQPALVQVSFTNFLPCSVGTHIGIVNR